MSILIKTKKISIDTEAILVKIANLFPENGEFIDIELIFNQYSNEIKNKEFIKQELKLLNLLNENNFLICTNFNKLKIHEKIEEAKRGYLLNALNSSYFHIFNSMLAFKYNANKQNVQERSFTSALSNYINNNIKNNKGLSNLINILSTNEISYPLTSDNISESLLEKINKNSNSIFNFYSDISMQIKFHLNEPSKYIIEFKFNKNSNNFSNDPEKLIDLIKLIIYMIKIKDINKTIFICSERPSFDAEGNAKKISYSIKNLNSENNILINYYSFSLYELKNAIEGKSNKINFNSFYNNSILTIFRGKKDFSDIDIDLASYRVDFINNNYNYLSSLIRNIDDFKFICSKMEDDDFKKFLLYFDSKNPLLYKMSYKYNKKIKDVYEKLFKTNNNIDVKNIKSLEKSFSIFCSEFKKWFKTYWNHEEINYESNFVKISIVRLFTFISLVHYLNEKKSGKNSSILFDIFHDYNTERLKKDYDLFCFFMNNEINNKNIKLDELEELILLWFYQWNEMPKLNIVNDAYKYILNIRSKLNNINKNLISLLLSQFIVFNDENYEWINNVINLEELVKNENEYNKSNEDYWTENYENDYKKYLDNLNQNALIDLKLYNENNDVQYKTIRKKFIDLKILLSKSFLNFMNEISDISKNKYIENIDSILTKFNDISNNFIALLREIFKKTN